MFENHLQKNEASRRKENNLRQNIEDQYMEIEYKTIPTMSNN
jgi:hypothetical protein